MHNVVKWPKILQKSCGVHTARFLNYVWPFYNIMHERVNKFNVSYEHFIIMGNFNIDVTNRRVEFDKLYEFCDLFNLRI